MKNILTALAFLLSVGFMVSCSGTTEKQPAVTETTEATTESATTTDSTSQLAYICPMKCEGSASATPGKCPVCGMDLVKNPDHKASGDSTTAGH